MVNIVTHMAYLTVNHIIALPETQSAVQPTNASASTSAHAGTSQPQSRASARRPLDSDHFPPLSSVAPPTMPSRATASTELLSALMLPPGVGYDFASSAPSSQDFRDEIDALL